MVGTIFRHTFRFANSVSKIGARRGTIYRYNNDQGGSQAGLATPVRLSWACITRNKSPLDRINSPSLEIINRIDYHADNLLIVVSVRRALEKSRPPALATRKARSMRAIFALYADKSTATAIEYRCQIHPRQA